VTNEDTSKIDAKLTTGIRLERAVVGVNVLAVVLLAVVSYLISDTRGAIERLAGRLDAIAGRVEQAMRSVAIVEAAHVDERLRSLEQTAISNQRRIEALERENERARPAGR